MCLVRNSDSLIHSNYFECISHSPVYLPKRACNLVSPSQLLLLTPGHFVSWGIFLPAVAGAQELLEHRTSFILALPIERRERLHAGSVTQFLLNLQYRSSHLAPF